MAKETIHRFLLRLNPISLAPKHKPSPIFNPIRIPITRHDFPNPLPFFPTRKTNMFSAVAKAGWLLGLREKNKTSLPPIVKAGDPVFHEPAQEVDPKEIGSDKIKKTVDDMVKVMRLAPGVGLAAPQIGVPLRIIVLEDTKEYIRYQTKEEIKAQDRHPFDLLRNLDVEVTSFDCNGQPTKVDAKGWQARILQHECDHLDGTLYVDKMVSKTFRITKNLGLPLAEGCPKLGVR
ncbi:hypothetical protein ACOSQ2_021128 [Xanthoceras sorbifolium]